MTIPGRGDLAPPRRHVPIGRWLTVALVVLLLGGGGYAAYRGLTGGSSSTVATKPKLAVCPKPAITGLFAPPSQVHLTIYNASLRAGLAAEVQASLRQRGFHIAQIGNALRVGKNIATVRYSTDELRASRTVAAQIPGKLTLKPVAGQHVLELDLGVNFANLRAKAAAKAAERQQAAATSPSPTPSASPTANCRPHP